MTLATTLHICLKKRDFTHKPPNHRYNEYQTTIKNPVGEIITSVLSVYAWICYKEFLSVTAESEDSRFSRVLHQNNNRLLQILRYNLYCFCSGNLPQLETSDSRKNYKLFYNHPLGGSPGKCVWSPLTQPCHPLMRKKRSDMQRWKRWQMIIENLRRQPLQIALGSTMTFWHFSESSKSDKSPHAV